MHRLTIRLVVVLVAALAGSLMAGPIQVQSVSVISSAPSTGGNGDSCLPVFSADGRYVLFASAANNLLVASNGLPIPSRVPAQFNVYLRDRLSQTTTLVSTRSNGVAGGNGDSFPVALSTNGQFALFESSASDLVDGDTNNATDVYLRDLFAGTTTLVSVTTDNLAGNGPSHSSVMTPDAQYVAFVSSASNLVSGDINRIADVFLRDLQTLTTTRVSAGAMSTNAAAIVPVGSSISPQISDDGRFIAFSSMATNVVTNVRTVGDLYVYDRVVGTNLWASSGMRAAMQAAKGTSNGLVCDFALSADGNFVAYQVNVSNNYSNNSGVLLRYGVQNGTTELLHANVPTSRPSPEETKSLDITADGSKVAFVANSNNVHGTTTCIQVWDAVSGLNTLASGNLSNLVISNSLSFCPALDSSGRYVAFRSSATGLVATAVSADWHVYRRDLLNGSTALVDAGTSGKAGLATAATVPAISADGRLVGFESIDAELVSSDNNHHLDVFVRDLDSGTNELISAHDPTLGSATPNRPSVAASFSTSTDGRYIAFASEANNLVAADTNGFRDIFIRDLATNLSVLVSVGLGGVQGNGLSLEPSLSGDGRYVAFSSTASNLAIGDTNKSSDVFVRDLQSGTTVVASVKLNGSLPGNKASSAPGLSADGRWLLFRSEATDLTGAFSFSGVNLFVRDLQNGTNYALTTAGAGPATMTPSGRFVAFGVSTLPTRFHVWDSVAGALVYTNNTANMMNLAISSDGNLLAYQAGSELRMAERAAQTNWLVSSGIFSTGVVFRATLPLSADGKWLAYARWIAPWWQTFLYDVQNRVETLVSHEINSANGGSGHSDLPVISPDGRFVVYGTSATNIVAGGNGLVRQLVIYDRQTGLNRLITANALTGQPGENYSLRAAFSRDGQTLVFQSWASGLVDGDFNRAGDLFVHPILTAVILPSSTGQGPWLSWPFLPGNNYEVQFKNNLGDALWQTLPSGYTNSANKAWQQDTPTGPASRFYRINVF